MKALQPLQPLSGIHQAREQLTAAQAMQLQQWGAKTAEHHHRIPRSLQLIKQLLQGSQLVKGAQLSQRREQGQTLRIGAHQAGSRALAVGV